MIENRPIVTVISHTVIILGIVIVAFPIWMTFVASSHDAVRMAQMPLPLLPGGQFFSNLMQVIDPDPGNASTHPVGVLLLNSLIMALMISIGKIVISMLSAFAIVYFKFPFRMTFFWMIFITLMLPVEVRIIPTFQVVANLGMLDNYWGLTIPLIASATATFWFRQVFLSIPDELLEASRIDGAGPMRFFFDVVIPMARTSTAALFVILFIYGWNQYLWPLLITTDEGMYTIVMSIKQMLEGAEEAPQWHLIMMTTLLAMLPPVAVVVSMQRLFVSGLTETEK